MAIPTRPLAFRRHSPDEMQRRADNLFSQLERRRSVRFFSPEPIPVEVVRRAIHTAGQAPSGANKQPWTFVLVTDQALKSRIRVAVEEAEQKFYSGGASEQWLADLAHLGTGPQKPYIETAPALIVVFAQTSPPDDGKHYYVKESVGLACGFLIAALHMAGFATLTHTPSPMGFLGELLDRPKQERPYLLLPVGYPAADCQVPDIGRKDLTEILVEHNARA